MFQPLETIQSFVAPVVMVSANGLLCLAFYNRLSALANRARTMHKERFDLGTRLAAMQAGGAESPEAVHIGRRVADLDKIGHVFFDRVRWIRRTLIGLLLSVLCLLGCSLCLGLATLFAPVAAAALGLFVAGTLSMMAGVAMAIVELRLSLRSLVFEHEQIEDLP